MKILRLLPIAILLIALAFPLMPAVPAYAATETLRPNAAGDETALAKWSVDYNWQAVDEEVADETTTYVYNNTSLGYLRDLYNLPAHSIGSGTINFIKIYFRCKYTSSQGYAKPSLKSDSTVTDGTEITLTTSWVTYSQQWDTNPADSQAWEWTDIDALQIGVSLRRTGTGWAQCTQVYVEVDYGAAPTVTTSAATNITTTTATLNGNVTATGGENPTVTVYWGDNDGGQVPGSWDYSSAPTSPSQPQGVAAFYKNVTDLSPGTLYYFSAKATNSSGTGWGTTQSFYTLGPPVVTSQAATNVEETTATFNGTITFASPACNYRGFVWGTTSKADPGDVAPADSGYDTFWIQSGSYGTGPFSRDITDLTPGTTWYYRACAHNTYGWDYSNTQQTVYTKPGDPSNLVATAVSSSQIDLTWTAGAGAEKTMVRGKQGSYPTGVSDGYQVYFDTGTSASDTDLSQSTTYYYRAWAWDTNSGYSDGYSQASATTFIGGRHLALWIQYEHDNTFHDLSSYDNDATPTFRTTSSDPDVSATFQNFRPIKEAVCTAGITEETPEMLTTPPEMPAEFYTEGSVNHLPGAALINNLLDAGGIPQDLFWIPFCFGLAAVASVFSYYFLKSMFFISIIGGVIILFFAATGAIPLWTFLIYAIIAGGVLVSERTFGW
jgi:hypothetical protein